MDVTTSGFLVIPLIAVFSFLVALLGPWIYNKASTASLFGGGQMDPRGAGSPFARRPPPSPYRPTHRTRYGKAVYGSSGYGKAAGYGKRGYGNAGYDNAGYRGNYYGGSYGSGYGTYGNGYQDNYRSDKQQNDSDQYSYREMFSPQTNWNENDSDEDNNEEEYDDDDD